MMNKRDNIQKIIDTRLANLKVSSGLRERILNRETKQKPYVRRISIVAIAACISLCLIVGAAAVEVPYFNKLV